MNNDESDLSFEEFRKSISKQRVTVLMIISLALVFGPTLFAVIAGVIAKNSDSKNLEILQTVNFILAAVMFVMSNVIPGVILRGNSEFQNQGAEPAEKILNSACPENAKFKKCSYILCLSIF